MIDNRLCLTGSGQACLEVVPPHVGTSRGVMQLTDLRHQPGVQWPYTDRMTAPIGQSI